MNSNEVLEIYQLFKDNAVHIWIDGGWGVDALLNEITRKHSDLDIVIELKFKEKAISLLKEKGFIEIMKPDSRACNFVYGCKSRFIDFHIIKFDQFGNGIYGPIEDGIYYPDYAFNGIGTIDGVEVNCISPQYQIESHTGYKLSSKDFHDVSLLSKRFGIPAPREYSIFGDED